MMFRSHKISDHVRRMLPIWIANGEEQLKELRNRIKQTEEAIAYWKKLQEDDRHKRELSVAAERRIADRIDGYDRDDLGESPDY